MSKVLAFFALNLLAFYANAENSILLLGAGSRTCNQYIEDIAFKTDNETYDLLYSTWLQGYISGRNVQLELLKLKSVNLESTMKISTILLKYCLDTRNIGAGDVALSTIADAIFINEFKQKVK